MGKSNVYLEMSEKGFKSGARGSIVSGKEGLIEVLGYEFQIEQFGSEEGGRPRSVEGTKRSPFTFKKAADDRTPLLFNFCVRGEYISKATLKVYGGESVPYLEYVMTYVHISNFHPSGGDDLSVEEIGLSYGQLSVKFDHKGLGSTAGSVEREWSWVMEMPKAIIS